MYRVRTLAPVILGALMMAAAVFMTLQPTAEGGRHHAGPPKWWDPPADVRAMLRDVSARKLKEYDLKLVSFGTRHTLSEQDNPTHGIGAARDYIKSQFDQIAATSGGRMTTELQSFIQPVSSRIPVPTRITNVVATLHGTDPTRRTASMSSPATTTRAVPMCSTGPATLPAPTTTAPAPRR